MDMTIIEKYEKKCSEIYPVNTDLYDEFHVKRGLRDKSGQGVVAGITNISKIVACKKIDGINMPCEGELYYRGYSINELVDGLIKDDRYGFEEVAHLLLLGELPNKSALDEFNSTLSQLRKLPKNFTRDVILKAPTKDMMMSLSKSVLTLGSYDKKADDISVPNVIRQCLMLISVFPMLAVYGYHAYNHFICDDSLYIHRPDDSLSTAQNFLRMLRPDQKFSELEAKVLDLAFILHMEHGGGNNSTFTTRVVTSSGTDTYSAISAALASLKGPKHGGANIKVVQMMKHIRENVRNIEDEDEVYAYLIKILKKRCSTAKDSSTVWDTPCIRCPTRERRFSNVSLSSFQNQRAKINFILSMSSSSDLPQRQSQTKGRYIKEFRQTSIFTADSFTVCWVFPSNFIRLCSLSPE